MVYRYIIKLDKKEDVDSMKNYFAKDEHENKIILNSYFYSDETEELKGDHFLFYESDELSINYFLDNDDNIKISEEDIIEVNELSDEIISDINNKNPDFVYITNFPRKFKDANLLDLLLSLPKSENYRPKIERLPCVFKVFFENSKKHLDFIKSILRFCPYLEFSTDNIVMFAETNCLKIPVIHFIDLPPTISTIEYFIEILKNDLGDYVLYEENDRKDNQPISFNISYKTENEAWDIIDQLNFHPFEGEEIRVNHFIDTKFLQEMSTFNIKVTNYEGDFDSYDIYEKFSKFGSIYSIYNSNPLIDESESTKKYPYQPNSSSNPTKDYFCIQYYLKQNAIDAVKQAAAELNMQNLTLTMKDVGIVVYNFKMDITEDEVNKIFPNTSKIVIKKSKDRNSRPYVFVNFFQQEDLEKAQNICKETYSDGLRLMCVPQTMSRDQAFLERRKEEEKCQRSNTIFIQKIPENVFAEAVIQQCKRFGKIDSFVFIDIRNSKVRKRLAKVSFHEEKEFNAATKSTITLGDKKIRPVKYIPHSH